MNVLVLADDLHKSRRARQEQVMKSVQMPSIEGGEEGHHNLQARARVDWLNDREIIRMAYNAILAGNDVRSFKSPSWLVHPYLLFK